MYKIFISTPLDFKKYCMTEHYKNSSDAQHLIAIKNHYNNEISSKRAVFEKKYSDYLIKYSETKNTEKVNIFIKEYPEYSKNFSIYTYNQNIPQNYFELKEINNDP